MHIWFLPLHRSAMKFSYFASLGFSFLIFKMKVKMVLPSRMLMKEKKKVLNACKMGNKVPSMKSALNISLLLLIITLDVNYFCL